MERLDVTEIFQGIPLPGYLHTQESMRYATEFKFQDTDTLIVTYPKSGTTWMQEIVTLVRSKGSPERSQSQPNWARAPWIEQHYCPDLLNSLQGPRVLTTHLQYKLLAKALHGSKAKVIYVARNPKDVVVSYFHFHKMAKFLSASDLFPGFLDAFLDGTLHYGSWFDHVKEWTSNSKYIHNFLYITYEEMWTVMRPVEVLDSAQKHEPSLIRDLAGSLQRVSQFLECPLLEEELTNSLKVCSFSNMRDNSMVNYTLVPQDIMDHSKGKFMRRGEIGDWVNTFSVEQSHWFNDVYASKMADSPLTFVWHKPGQETI